MNVETINPLELPSLPLERRRELPNRPAIYFVMQGENILYIGQTANLAQRWLTHHTWSYLVKLSSNIKISWLECPDKELLRKIETALIEQFEPELNGKPPTKRPKISIYISEEQKEVLDSWAKSETRTVSNLVSHLIEKGINEYTLLNDKNKPTKQLASNNKGELEAFLKLLTNDKPPSDPDLIELAHDLELDVKLLISLRDRLFPTRPKQPNGHK